VNDEQPTVDPVEITITARDAKNNAASYHFQYTPRKPGVEEAINDLRYGFTGQIDRRITQVDSER
jgi:hypothetical protein